MKPGDTVISMCPDCLPRRGPKVKATLKAYPSNGKVNLVVICDNCGKNLGVIQDHYE
jgi:hypothetical protein